MHKWSNNTFSAQVHPVITDILPLALIGEVFWCSKKEMCSSLHTLPFCYFQYAHILCAGTVIVQNHSGSKSEVRARREKNSISWWVTKEHQRMSLCQSYNLMGAAAPTSVWDWWLPWAGALCPSAGVFQNQVLCCS